MKLSPDREFSGAVAPLMVHASDLLPQGWDPVSDTWGRLLGPEPDTWRLFNLHPTLAAGGRDVIARIELTHIHPDATLTGQHHYLGIHQIPVEHRVRTWPPDPEDALPLLHSGFLSGPHFTSSRTGVHAAEARERKPVKQLLEIIHADGRLVVPDLTADGAFVGHIHLSPDGGMLACHRSTGFAPNGARIASRASVLDSRDGSIVQTSAEDMHPLGSAPWNQDGERILVDAGTHYAVWHWRSNRTEPFTLERANYRDFDDPDRGRGSRVLGWADSDSVLLNTRPTSKTISYAVMNLATGHRTPITKVTGVVDMHTEMAMMPDGYWRDLLDHLPAPARRSSRSSRPGTRIDAAASTRAPGRSVPAARGTAWVRLRELLTTVVPLAEGPDVPDAWAAGLHADFPQDGDITVDPRTLMPIVTATLVEGPDAFDVVHPDHSRLTSALDAAAELMLRVDEHGEVPHQTGDADGEQYTPNSASAVTIHPGRVRVTIDAQGVTHCWRNRTILHLTVAHLRGAGLTGARIEPTV